MLIFPEIFEGEWYGVFLENKTPQNPLVVLLPMLLGFLKLCVSLKAFSKLSAVSDFKYPHISLFACGVGIC